MKTINALTLLFSLFFSGNLSAQNNCENDVIAPTAVCISSLQVTLEGSGETTLVAQDIDDGSSDDCSEITFSFFSNQLQPTILVNTETMSPTSISIYVTDASGNQSSCDATLYVQGSNNTCEDDTTAPTAVCNDEEVVHLNQENTAILHTSVIDGGSADNCSTVTVSFSETEQVDTLTFDENTVSPTVVFLYATDENGNQSVCWSNVLIDGNVSDCTNDTESPLVVCNAEFTLVLDENNEASLAIDLVHEYSIDNCSNVTISFSETGIVEVATFDENTVSPINVSLYARDENDNQAMCWAAVTILNGAAAGTFGYVRTESGEGIPNVNINALFESGQVAETTMTDAEGRYEFSTLVIGTNYTIQPEKNTNAMNGVTTFDLLLASRHILGQQYISSPYRLFAADVNGSNALTTFDMVTTRKLILGYTPEFENTSSWKFLRSTATFPDMGGFALGEIVNNNFQMIVGTTNTAFNFIGVKAGDLNASASVD